MTDYGNVNHPGKVVYRIDHTVIADTNPPEIFLSMKFDVTDGPRIFCQGFNLRQNSASDVARQSLQFLARGTSEADGIISHSAGISISTDAGPIRDSRAVHERAIE